MSGRLAVFSTLLLLGLVIAAILIALIDPLPTGLFSQGAVFANISGFVAVFLIGATGVMTLFRKPVLRSTKDAEAFRELHVLLAALGGLFLIFHVAFFLLFPLTLPVLFGYVGSYLAFVVWVSGALFLEGFRSSLFYHSLLSLVGISLIIVHVFSAGRGIPVLVSGVALVVIASVVLVGALKQLTGLPPGQTAPSGTR